VEQNKVSTSADHVIEVVSAVHNGLAEREKLGANQTRTRILKDDLAFHTVPDAAKLQQAWPHNMHLDRSLEGHIVQFEAWGSADVSALSAHWGNGRFLTAMVFLHELLNMMVVELSHRERRLLGVLTLVDAGGMTTYHAELLQFLAEAREMRRTIYPCMVAEVVVLNSSVSGATRRALRALQLPGTALQFDEDRRLISAQRVGGSGGRNRHRVAPILTPHDGASRNISPETWLEALLEVSGADSLDALCDATRSKDLSIHERRDAAAWNELRTGLDGIEAEWRKHPESGLRVYRFSAVLKGVNARDAFIASWESIGTDEFYGFGDKSASLLFGSAYKIANLTFTRAL